MATRRDCPDRIRNERDVIAVVEAGGGEWEQARGSHLKWKANGRSGPFYRLHNGRDQYPAGTARAIERQLRAAGLLAVLVLGLLLAAGMW